MEIFSYRLPFQPTYFVSTYSIFFVIEVTGDLYLKRGNLITHITSFLKCNPGELSNNPNVT